MECWTAPFLRRRTSGIRYALGHDCAVLHHSSSNQTDLVLKTDAVVEGVHFTRSTPPSLIGRKALARPLSDLAAAGATPGDALLSILMGPDVEAKWLEDFAYGAGRAAASRGGA
ncbi:MAG: hypothetical protein EBR83_10795 [Verrucomicrobia bacterium]|nr:hypothetical protein [Verrucomicrobiota bacterium]